MILKRKLAMSSVTCNIHCLVWSATVCLLLHDFLLKADSERLQTSLPGAGFEPTDCSTKLQPYHTAIARALIVCVSPIDGLSHHFITLHSIRGFLGFVVSQ